MKYLPLILFFLAPSIAFGASIHAISQPEVRAGEVFPVEVFLDTEGQNINALEGTLELSSGVSLEDVRFNGSVVSFWLEEPKKGSGSVLSFSGVIPAGYQGSPEKFGKGNLFSLYLKSPAPGVAKVTFRDSVAYLNDGEGTAVNLSKGPAQISVTKDGLSGAAPMNDVYPPEIFNPEIVSGEPYGLLGDVLVFSTLDKDSGVDRYEVGFSYIGFMPEIFASYAISSSPLEISNKEREKYIFVRAVDRDGNVRTASIQPNFGLAVILTWGIPVLAILLVSAVVVYAISRAVSLKRKSKANV